MALSVRTKDGIEFYAVLETLPGVPPFFHMTEEEAAEVERDIFRFGVVREPYRTLISQAIGNFHSMSLQGSC